MKILIVGAQGMLGQGLVEVFADQEVVAWGHAELDITDEEQVRNKIAVLKPDIIINSVAYNNVDAAEQNFCSAMKINGEAPINLAKAAEQVGARFIHYSSDYVFDGTKKEGYHETDQPASISLYGKSKLAGEKALDHCSRCYLIRTSRLFGLPASSQNAKQSFVDVMLKLGKERQILDLVAEEYSSPTYVVDLAKQTRVLLEGHYQPGIYHITNEGACTWHEFGKEIFQQLSIQVKTNPVSREKLPRPARRPAYSLLINTKLPKLRSWQEALKSYLLKNDTL